MELTAITMEDINDLMLEELNDYQKGLLARFAKDAGEVKDAESPNVHDEMFAQHNNGDKTAQRIIMPYTMMRQKQDNTEDFYQVANTLKNHGWEIHDYNEGIATRRRDTKFGPKPEFKRIGAILKEHKHDDVLHTFNNDINRSLSNKDSMQIVVSRHPEDVVGMSTDRGWTSCMRLPNDRYDSGGCNHHFLQSDLAHQSLVAYLTKRGDDNVDKPIARIAIKKMVSKEGHKIWRPELSSYGTGDKGFLPKVNALMKTHYPANHTERYSTHRDLYNDTRQPYVEEKDKVGESSSSRHIKLYVNEGNLINKTTNEKGDFHSYDDKPALVFKMTNVKDFDLPKKHVSHIEQSEWYDNGLLHRTNGPATKTEVITHDGKRLPLQHAYHLYGHIHDHKDGSPAIESITYDKHLNPTSHTAEYKRFGIDNSGVMSGVSKVILSNHGKTGSSVSLYRHSFGSLNNNGNGPSTVDLEYKKGKIASKRTTWFNKDGKGKYGNSAISEEYKKDALEKYHEEHNGYSWDDMPLIKHSWSSGNGYLVKSVGKEDNTRIKRLVTYKSSSPTENPTDIKSVEHQDIYSSQVLGPNNEAAYWGPSGYSFIHSDYDNDKNVFKGYPNAIETPKDYDYTSKTPNEIHNDLSSKRIKVKSVPYDNNSTFNISPLNDDGDNKRHEVYISGEKFNMYHEFHNGELKESDIYGNARHVNIIHDAFKTDKKYAKEINSQLKENGLKYSDLNKDLDHYIKKVKVPTLDEVKSHRVDEDLLN